jgi:5-bromo-4-chloroindolyl phosphate hydrolysis protein
MTTAHFESVLGAPHSLEPVALLSLVLIFLIIEIPLVVSIFRAGSMEERSQKADPEPFSRVLPGPDRP